MSDHGDDPATPERPEQLAQRLWLSFRGHNWDLVLTLLHPEARIESSLAPGRTLTAHETVEYWRNGIRDGLFDPKPVGFVELDDNRVLLLGPLRPTTEVGDADAYVLTFRDGLLWRANYYASVEEAERAGAGT